MLLSFLSDKTPTATITGLLMANGLSLTEREFALTAKTVSTALTAQTDKMLLRLKCVSIQTLKNGKSLSTVVMHGNLQALSLKVKMVLTAQTEQMEPTVQLLKSLSQKTLTVTITGHSTVNGLSLMVLKFALTAWTAVAVLMA